MKSFWFVLVIMENVQKLRIYASTATAMEERKIEN